MTGWQFWLSMLSTLPLVTGCTGRSTATHASVAPTAGPSDTGACATVAFPKGPAGRRLAELVAATNAPEVAPATAFVASGMTDDVRQRHGGFVVGNAGDELGFDLCRVDFVAPTAVVATLGGKSPAGDFVYGVVAFALDDHGKIAAFAVLPATAADLEVPVAKLSESDVRTAVDGIAAAVTGYVFVDKGVAMARRIRGQLASGAYDGIENGHLLALVVSEDLYAVTGDKHLEASYHAVAPEPPHDPTPAELDAIKKVAVRDNFGMPVAEIRDGGIAYLKVLGFVPPELGAEAMSATMSKLADAEVLIIDLRENGGGSPEGVAYMASYLFGDTPVHLNDIYNRQTDRTQSSYTNPELPGRRLGPGKPVYVLTSSYTFSAAEEFAYDLQALGRATIVGEVTGGGAHPVEMVPVSEHWSVFLPTSRSINPITKTNWEGTGVQPDVVVPAASALDTAVELAAKVRATTANPARER